MNIFGTSDSKYYNLYDSRCVMSDVAFCTGSPFGRPSCWHNFFLQEPKPRSSFNGKARCCVLCRTNGEPRVVFESHSLKDDVGLVTCPVLYSYVCPYCGATGPQAHSVTGMTPFLGRKETDSVKSPQTTELTVNNSHGWFPLFKSTIISCVCY